MSNISFSTIYGDSLKEDRYFDENSCQLSENLLVPNVLLKKALEERGHNCHTMDCYPVKDIDVAVFADAFYYSIFAIDSPIKFLKYLMKKKWRQDDLLQVILHNPKAKRILLISEPPVINKASYKKRVHKCFHHILTWKDDLLGDEKYSKFFYPEVIPSKTYLKRFDEKKMVTLIASNKDSSEKGELYSKRKEAIRYFEKNKDYFDLYGFGWNEQEYSSYRGTVDKKLETLSSYRFCICYENQKEITGYITEKIFDCFFANCIPVYWGASNITDFIPADTFIDRTQFQDYSELSEYMENMSEEEYQQYLANIHAFLESDAYRNTFDVGHYVDTVLSQLV